MILQHDRGQRSVERLAHAFGVMIIAMRFALLVLLALSIGSTAAQEVPDRLPEETEPTGYLMSTDLMGEAPVRDALELLPRAHYTIERVKKSWALFVQTNGATRPAIVVYRIADDSKNGTAVYELRYAPSQSVESQRPLILAKVKYTTACEFRVRDASGDISVSIDDRRCRLTHD